MKHSHPLSLRSITWIFALLAAGALAAMQTQAATQIIADEAYENALLAALDDARPGEDVRVLAFSFAIDSGGRIDGRLAPTRVAEKLIQLKNRGVRVSVYLESERDTAARNEITAKYLEQNGIAVKRGATHAKGVSVGQRHLIFGSTNLTEQSIRLNNETNIHTDDTETVAGFNRFFTHLWEGGAHDGIQLAAPLFADSAYKEQLLNAIRTATKTLDFSIYYFNHLEIEQALIQAANRGVVIRGYLNFDSRFAPELVKKNQETVTRLKEAGVSQLYFDKDGSHTHSKYLIVDGQKILLGTGNWNASDINTHRQLYIQIDDPHLATALSAYLSQQIAFERSGPPLPRHTRIWVGARSADPLLSENGFRQAIREIFVPATAEAIGGRGGEAYQPALILQGGQTLHRARGDLVLPDEVALIAYSDALTYRAARDTPVGQVYGPLHREFFLMDPSHPRNSKSTVSETWTGQTQLGHAYDLSQNESFDQQLPGSVVILHLRRDDLAMSDDQYLAGVSRYLDSLQKTGTRPLSLQGYQVLVTREYVLEYVHFSRVPETGATPQSGSIYNHFSRAPQSALDILDSLKKAADVFEPTPHQSEVLQVVRPQNALMDAVPGQSGVSVVFPRDLNTIRSMSECRQVLLSTSKEHAARLSEIRKALLRGKPIP